MMKQHSECQQQSLPTERTLYIAFELSNKKWKLGFSNGKKRRWKTIPARDLDRLTREIAAARERLGVSAESRTLSCYEAGRDGFWLHRYLSAQGIENLVVDAGSLEVNRRARRAKTDQIDVAGLLRRVIQYDGGDSKVWSVVRVPDDAAEDGRRLHRELERLKKERTGHRNRITSLLIAQGLVLAVGSDFVEQVKAARRWNGTPVPPTLQQEVFREYARYHYLQAQIREVEQAREQTVKRSQSRSARQVRQLRQLYGIGPVSSWTVVKEYLGWREFHNGKEVGACAGFTPTPWSSGDLEREQGISKAGNRRIRALMIEVSWNWLRYQPQSQLSQWFQRRFGMGGKRMRRIGIVAVARKLLIALWRYLEHGIPPAGARLVSTT
jgi:transposase